MMGWTPKSFYSLIRVFQVDKLNVASFIDAFSKLLVIFIKFARHTLVFIGFALLLTVRCTETGML